MKPIVVKSRRELEAILKDGHGRSVRVAKCGICGRKIYKGRFGWAECKCLKKGRIK